MKRFFQNKITLSPLRRWLLFVGLSLFIFLFTVFLQAGPVLNTLKNLLRAPLLLVLNLLPITAVLGLAYALLGNLFYAGSVTSLLFHLLSLTNLIKIECRKDPLVPPDFSLLGEAMIATGEYQLNLHIPYLVFIVLFAIALVLLGVKFKSRPKLWRRLAIGLLVIALLIGAMLTVYPDKDLYLDLVDTVPDLSYTNVPKVFDEIGFVYCFLHNVGLYEVEKPEGYQTDTVRQWISEAPSDRKPEAPEVQVILIQCEAFSELYDAEVFSYAPEDHPLYRFHQVADSDQAIYGHIVVSNYGAGTANTEFDIMTGVQTNGLNETASSAFRMVHKNIDSIARIFRRSGYDAWFMHPGQSWFYNRESVYHYLGMDDQCFADGFADPVIKGNWISDESFGKKLIAEYEAHKARSDAPWFAFTVTVQNHQSYPWSKYSQPVEKAPIRVPVSDGTMETASVYAEGIRDSSQLLYDLTQYFDREEKPTLIVFWGDHLPALGSSFRVYRELGLDIGNEADLSWALETYTTPYVIWGNRAYCDTRDLAAGKAALDLPEKGRISDIYLGSAVYELLGLRGTDPYFDYLCEARRILPVLCRGRYELPDGTITEDPGDRGAEVVKKLSWWGYYRVKEEPVPGAGTQS